MQWSCKADCVVTNKPIFAQDCYPTWGGFPGGVGCWSLSYIHARTRFNLFDSWRHWCHYCARILLTMPLSLLHTVPNEQWIYFLSSSCTIDGDMQHGIWQKQSTPGTCHDIHDPEWGLMIYFSTLYWIVDNNWVYLPVDVKQYPLFLNYM